MKQRKIIRWAGMALHYRVCSQALWADGVASTWRPRSYFNLKIFIVKAQNNVFSLDGCWKLILHVPSHNKKNTSRYHCFYFTGSMLMQLFGFCNTTFFRGNIFLWLVIVDKGEPVRMLVCFLVAQLYCSLRQAPRRRLGHHVRPGRWFAVVVDT